MTALVPDLDGYTRDERPAAQSDPAEECARWIAGGVVDNDREEARRARLAAERAMDTDHGPCCRCGSCVEDLYEPDRW